MAGTWKYIESDFYRYRPIKGSRAKRAIIILLYALSAKIPGFTYSFWWRLGAQKSPLGFLARLKARHLGRVYCIDLPVNTPVGYGLYLGHGMGIVVNPLTRIGNNVNISHFVAIGTNRRTPAIIGDNVYIGPNVSIVEDVVIGNNVTIGAGSVVTRSLPEGCTAVGSPCKPLNFDSPGRYIGNPWLCD